jgi:transcriptional regulator with XRE-family HTH domain
MNQPRRHAGSSDAAPRSEWSDRDQRVFGRAVRELRARRCLTQERLGFASDLHRNYVGAIERGEINPTLRVVSKLSDGLRVSLADLMGLYETRRDERL